MNGKQFGEKYGKKYVKCLSVWHEKGYLGFTTKDYRTGIYNIPDDLPLPYGIHSRVSRTSTLMYKILDAADKRNSVFPSMFPKISEEIVLDVEQELIDEGYIEKQETNSGVSFLKITPTGIQFLNSLNDGKSVMDRIDKYFRAGMTVMEILVMMRQSF